MRGFVGRRRQQQFASLFGMLCLALCACTDGTGTPLVLADGGQAGSSGTGTSSAGHSGMHASDASVEDDDDALLNSECRSTNSMWPASAVSEEKKMVDELNALRANQTSLCPLPFALEPLLADPALQCAARKRALQASSPKSGGRPDSSVSYYGDQRSQDQSGARDRAKAAGSSRIDAEIVVYNVSSAAAVIDWLETEPDEAGPFCGAATAWFAYAGVARYGAVWVIALGRGLPLSTRPPTSGVGPSGPPGSGNSGTAGR